MAAHRGPARWSWLAPNERVSTGQATVICFCPCFRPISSHRFLLCVIYRSRSGFSDVLETPSQAIPGFRSFLSAFCLPGSCFPSPPLARLSPPLVFKDPIRNDQLHFVHTRTCLPGLTGSDSPPPPLPPHPNPTGLCAHPCGHRYRALRTAVPTPMRGSWPQKWCPFSLLPELSTKHSRNSKQKMFWHEMEVVFAQFCESPKWMPLEYSLENGSFYGVWISPS